MKPKVFIPNEVPKEVESYISEHCEIKRWAKEGRPTQDELIEAIHDVEGFLATGYKVNNDLLEAAPNLKVVSNMSVGYDNFDIDALKSNHVLATHTPFVLDDTVADLALGLILSTARRIPEMDQLIKSGDWVGQDDKLLYGTDVHHSTLGIIGMGRIGEAVARRAKLGFNMDVLYYNRSRKPGIEEELGVHYATLESLLKQSDFVLLLIPFTSETHHLIGKEELQLMKKTAILINISRGQTVDEKALIQALQVGTIHGAGLDVFEKEPIDVDNPLLKMSNVVVTPHIGSATAKIRFDMAMAAAENLVQGVTGKTPANVVKELDTE